VETEFERYLIEQCAPTLAGIKVGSLFRYPAEKDGNMGEIVRFWSDRLFDKGVRVCAVRECPDRGLIYVFRPSMLETLLSAEDIKLFLKSRGYDGCHDPDAYVHRLRHRLCSEPGFPHEIGIFLGYPLGDVQGFIENQGRNFNLCGLWKVYGEERNAERLFARYKKCRKIYRALYENGRSVLTLTVAA